MIQLIATDMDGTLLNLEKALPPQLPALLEELYRRDITFAVASGRSHMMLTSLFGELAEEMIFICDNGACVMQPHEAPVLHSLPKAVLAEILTQCHNLPHVMPVLCGFHHIYCPAGMEDDLMQEIRRYYWDIQELPYDALFQVEEPILKVAVCDKNGPETHTYPLLHQILQERYELLVSGDCWMDVMCKGITKGTAVRQLQEQLGITAAETAVFGDYDNDISMLQCADYSFAMQNAPARVRECARYLAPSNEDNGVVRQICSLLGLHYSALPKA